MNCLIRRDLRAIMIRSLAVLGLSICGFLTGLALALLVEEVLGQTGAEDRTCLSGLHGLYGGIALTQGINLIVVFVLCGHQRRRKLKRGA